MIYKSSTIQKTLNPVWQDTPVEIPISQEDVILKRMIPLEVFDADLVGHDDWLGITGIPVVGLKEGTPTDFRHKLKGVER